MSSPASTGTTLKPTAIIAAVFVAGAFAVFAYAWHLHRVSTANVPSECTVAASEVGYNQDAKYKPYWAEVTVDHEINGTKHRRMSSGSPYRDRNDALRDLSAFKVGARVRCYYVEGRPDLVTVFPGKDTESNGLFVFGGILLVVPVILVITNQVVRRRRR